MATLEDYFFTKNTKWILWGLLVLLVEALVFHAGVVVGSHSRVFMMQSGGPGMSFEARIPFGSAGVALPQGFIPGGHGALGIISTIQLPLITLASRDGTVLRVEVGSSTQVSGAPGATVNDLHAGDTIIVIGDPTDTDLNGEIDAKLIRIVDVQSQQGKTMLYVQQQ